MQRWNIGIIQAGLSRSKRFYPTQVLKAAAPRFNDTPGLLSTMKNAPTGTERKRTHPSPVDDRVRPSYHLPAAAWSATESARPAACLSAGNSPL
jgi:hypothetical protein